MRTNCPVCDSQNRIDKWDMDFFVPDGWEMPAKNKVCLCTDCGMIWYDNDRTQDDYNKFYQTRYGNSQVLSNAENLARQDELIELTEEYIPSKHSMIVDFGGGEGYITKRMIEHGYQNIMTVNIGDELPKRIDILIASQVMEHIYDVREVMERIVLPVSASNGKFIIEIPDTMAMPGTDLPLLDYLQPHVNHYLPSVLDLLFQQYDYWPIYTRRKIEMYHFGFVYRVIYAKDIPQRVYFASRQHIENSIKAMAARLETIRGPVIVWGCGDLCLHLLTQVKLNILQFVDLDPAFRGQTIGGIQVLDHVESDAPILVMVQNQSASIQQSIKDAGLLNEVIVL